MKEEKRVHPSDFEQSVNKSQNNPNSRRRGKILENDILQAVWAELAEVGYTHLTMEGVRLVQRQINHRYTAVGQKN